MRPEGTRDTIAGPDVPRNPFPLKLSGKVIKGFGRGHKELGIPTANIPLAGLSVGGNENLESGIYYGWAGLDHVVDPPADGDAYVDSSGVDDKHRSQCTHAMVMSIGWNPFYKNTVRSIEVHIMRSFARDFYGAQLNLVILGFIRPEYDYISRESLVDDIKTDIDVAARSLARPAYASARNDPFLVDFLPVELGRGFKQDIAS